MATATGGIFQTLSDGWNSATTQVSKAYTAACDLTRAGWNRFLQFDAVQKTINFAEPHFNTVKKFAMDNYPDALKFTWSTGTAVTVLGTSIIAGGILRSRESELSQINKQITKLETEEKALKKDGKDLPKTQQDLLDACKTRKTKLEE